MGAEKLKLDGILKKGEGLPSMIAFRACVLFNAVLAGVLVLLAIFYVWLYIQQVQNGYWLAKYQAEGEQLLATQRKLRLEWTRLQDLFQLEEMGSKQFGLAPPKQDQKILMR